MSDRSPSIKARDIVRLARPHFLIPGIILYSLGAFTAIAYGASVNLGVLVFGYLIFLLAHLSVHFSNDYFDRVGDRNSEPTGMSGGSGVLVEHPELAPLAIRIAIMLLLASIAVAFMFTVVYSYPLTFLLFSILGGLLAWFYTAPPLRLSYRGLGELSTIIAGGLVMPGMGYFVAAGTIDGKFVLLSLPLLCYGAYFIATVEMPDMDSDRLAGRNNLLVRHGLRVGVIVVLISSVTATAILLALAYTSAFGPAFNLWPMVFFSLFPLAVAVIGASRVLEQRPQLLSQVRLNMTAFMVIIALYMLVSALAAFW